MSRTIEIYRVVESYQDMPDKEITAFKTDYPTVCGDFERLRREYKLGGRNPFYLIIQTARLEISQSLGMGRRDCELKEVV